MKPDRVLIGAIGALLMLSSCSDGGTPPRTATASAVETTIETITVEARPTWVEAVGTVRAEVDSVLSSEVSGRVIELPAAEGDRVRAGQVLARLDSRTIEAEIARARAGVEEATAAVKEVSRSIEAAEAALRGAQARASLANSTFRRFQELLERKSVSRQEFDEAEAAFKAANSEVARAEEYLKALAEKQSQTHARVAQSKAAEKQALIVLANTQLKAPFDGIVTRRHVSVGQLALPATPLFSLDRLGSYRLEVSLEESQLGSVQVGQQVEVRVDAIGAVLKGKVAEIVPAVDASTRTFTVKIDLPASARLRSGLFGRAFIPSGRRQVLAVPRTAVVVRGQLTGVYVLDEAKRARFRLVKTGKEYDDRVEILTGLSDGDRVVVRPPADLKDGTLIRSLDRSGSQPDDRDGVDKTGRSQTGA